METGLTTLVKRVNSKLNSLEHSPNENTTNVFASANAVTTDETMHELKHHILEKAKRISSLLLEKNLQKQKTRIIKASSNELSSLIIDIQAYQELIRNKNKELLEAMDEFNAVILMLIDVSNKLNTAIAMRVTRTKTAKMGGRRVRRNTRRR